jgi:hypothetical protein
MENKQMLEDIHQQSLEKIEEYLKSKGSLKPEQHDKINEAKTKWQNSWADFMDVLMYLERIEL